MGTTWQPTAAAAPLAPPATAGAPDLGQGLSTLRWDTHVEAAWVGTELVRRRLPRAWAAMARQA